MSSLLDYLQTHEPTFKRLFLSCPYPPTTLSLTTLSPNRLASLYSDFHTRRQTNPEGYAANSTAWLSALTTLARAGLLPFSRSPSGTSRVSFTSGDPLLRALTSPRLGQPQGLGPVIADALHAGALVPRDRFLASERSIYARGWLAGALSWGLRAVGLGGAAGASSDKLVAGDMVLIAAVEEVAGSIARELEMRRTGAGPAERIYARAQFEAEFRDVLGGDAALTPADFEVLLRFLARDRPVLAYTKDTVKIAPAGVEHPDPVTAEDASIANLRALMSSMTARVDALQARVAILERDARAAVAAKQESRAKAMLRQKRAAETTLAQRSTTLEQLERTWASIEAAADNVAIVAAMRDSSAVLRGLNAKVGGAEGVDDVLDQLREDMEATEDISQAVADGGRVQVDESEVEEELAALENAERTKNAAQEREMNAAQERKQNEERTEDRVDDVRKQLEGLAVPFDSPKRREHVDEDAEDEFEEANETIGA